MKYLFAAFVLAGFLVIIYGSPLTGKEAASGHYYGSPEPILPMRFAHIDHTSESCTHCHHNYIDDTGNELCMTCHVNDEKLLAALEQQFHDLCRDCHAKKAARREDGGPPRRCISCHVVDNLP